MMRIQFAKESEFYKLETGSGFNNLKKNPVRKSWKKDPVSKKGEREKNLRIWEISNLL